MSVFASGELDVPGDHLLLGTAAVIFWAVIQGVFNRGSVSGGPLLNVPAPTKC